MILLFIHIDKRETILNKQYVAEVLDTLRQYVGVDEMPQMCELYDSTGMDMYTIIMYSSDGAIDPPVFSAIDYMVGNHCDFMEDLTDRFDKTKHAYALKMLCEDAGAYLEDITENVILSHQPHGHIFTVFDV